MYLFLEALLEGRVAKGVVDGIKKKEKKSIPFDWAQQIIQKICRGGIVKEWGKERRHAQSRGEPWHSASVFV